MNIPIVNLRESDELQGCVLAYGHFTTIHPGHIRYLRHARGLGKELVVALIGDGPPGSPAPFPFNREERGEALALLGIANKIVMLEGEEFGEVIKTLKPSVVVLGTELQGAPKLQEPLSLLKSQGGSVQFHAGETTYASADLLTNTEGELRQHRLRGHDRQG